MKKSTTETVKILHTCDKDLKSHGGFQWPASGLVEAPDFQPTPECGHGLHGLLDGEGDWSLLDWSIDAKALICEVEKWSLIDIHCKVKFRSALVIKVVSLAEGICELFCVPSKVAKEISEVAKEATVKTEDYSRLAASGSYSRLAASGHASRLAASGSYSQLAASGNDSQLAASGNDSGLAAPRTESRLSAPRGY